MANPEHVRIVKRGREAIARWRQEHPGERLDLSRADLFKADLTGASLSEVDLSWADIAGASLKDADLSGANLFGARLVGADLRRANLTGANLVVADLTGVNLTSADLVVADLTGANLFGAHLFRTFLDRAACKGTIWAICDLSQCDGLESVVHASPSTIGIDTLIASFRGAGNRLTPELQTFFRGAGVPQELLEALPRIVAEVKYCSCFIAYGEPDRAFAERLVNHLKAKGVSCWIYSMDATPGERTWREIGEKRRGADKMVVLCSAQALVRDGVLKEIEEQIDEEPDKMVPVSLDNLWKEPGFRVMRAARDLKPFLRERNYADFSDPSKYQQALERLLKALERKQG